MILLTGAKGFIGSYLSAYLEENGHQVVGDRELMPNFDIRNREMVHQLIADVKPEVIYHLAGQSSVPRSWREPQLTFEVNVIGTIHLLEEVRDHAPNAGVILASSSAIYGGSPNPISEDHPLRPLSPYGVSKAAMDLLGYSYFKSYGLDIIRARIFGTIGPGKRGDAVSDFANRIVSSQGPIHAGNIDAQRDLTDVRDTVKGLAILMEKGEGGEAYNLCRGWSYKIWDILEEMIALCYIKADVVVDPDLLRTVEEPVIGGDNSKIRALGWEPEIPIRKTLEDVLQEHRDKNGTRIVAKLVPKQ